MGFTFELTGDSGAALTTRHKIYRKDTEQLGPFEKYTKHHYNSWVQFSRKYGSGLRPVLVYGFDRTEDFAMSAYSTKSTSIEAGATMKSAPMFGPDSSASIQWKWSKELTPYRKHGPQDRIPPDSPSQRSPIETKPCVFIRYFTMNNNPIFPTVIKAGAGPHNLGSGERRADAFPELTVNPDAEPMSGGQDPQGYLDSATDGPRSELDVATPEIPYVRFFSNPTVSALIFVPRMKEMTAGMPLQATFSR